MKKITILAALCMFGFDLQGSAPIPNVADIYHAAKKDLQVTVDKVITKLGSIDDTAQKTELKQDLFDFIKKLDSDLQQEAIGYSKTPPKNQTFEMRQRASQISSERGQIEKMRNYAIQQLVIHCSNAC